MVTKQSISRTYCPTCLNPDGTATLTFNCRGCSCNFDVKFKHRNKREFCSLSCRNKYEHKKGIRHCTCNDEQPYRRWLRKFGKDEADRRNKIRGKKISIKIKRYKYFIFNDVRNVEKANFLRKISAENGRKSKGKKLEQIVGKEKAVQIKKKISIRTSGKNNPMYGKPSPKKSGNGWKGWYRGIFFRSLLELGFMLKCDQLGIQWETAENKKFRVTYYFLKSKRSSIPDFFLPLTGEIIEIKPKNLLYSPLIRAKVKAFRKKFNSFKIYTEDQVERPSLDVFWNLWQSEKIVITDSTKRKFWYYLLGNKKTSKEILKFIKT